MLSDSARSFFAPTKDYGTAVPSCATRSSASTASSSSASVPEAHNSIIGLRDRLLFEAGDNRNQLLEATSTLRQSLAQFRCLKMRCVSTQTETVASMTANAAAELRRELEQLRLSQLRKRGLASGLTAEQLERAEDTNEPHKAMLNLILSHELRRLEGKIAAAWSEQDDVAQENALKSIRMLGLHPGEAARARVLELENEVQRLQQRNEQLERELAAERKQSSVARQLGSEVELLCAHIASLEEQLEAERRVKQAALQQVDCLNQVPINKLESGSIDATPPGNRRSAVDSKEAGRATSPNRVRSVGTPSYGQVGELKVMQQLLREQELCLLQKDARIAHLAATLRGTKFA